MPAAIPVQLAHQSYPSQNQAKVHYSDMLNRYEPGQTVGAEDSADLRQLLKSHSDRARRDLAHIRHFHVTRGRFGKHCFAYATADNPVSKFSYVRCVTNASQNVREDACGEPLDRAAREQKNKAPATQASKPPAITAAHATSPANEEQT